MRLLLNMLHVIVQRFTIIARFISFNLPCCATSMYTMYKHLCFDHGCCCTNTSTSSAVFVESPSTSRNPTKIYGRASITHSSPTKASTTKKTLVGQAMDWKARVYNIYPLWIARAFVRSNARSYEHRTFSRTITWSLVRSYRIILQHSLSLYNSRI